MKSYRTADTATPAKGYVFTLPSLTIPGQSLSLKDLLERYVISGTTEMFNAQFTGEDETDIPDNLEKMDKMEKIHLARELRLGIEDAREKLHEQSKKQTAKDAPKSTDGPPTTEPPALQSEAGE